MIRRFCDGCGSELTDQRTGRIIREAVLGLHTVRVEVIVAVDGTWNAGDVCRLCVVTAVCEGEDVDHAGRAVVEALPIVDVSPFAADGNRAEPVIVGGIQVGGSPLGRGIQIGPDPIAAPGLSEDELATLHRFTLAVPCCGSHLDGPTRDNGMAHCCDTDDCGPCCQDCPTCPTLVAERIGS
jgi:hypothetical protein